MAVRAPVSLFLERTLRRGVPDYFAVARFMSSCLSWQSPQAVHSNYDRVFARPGDGLFPDWEVDQSVRARVQHHGITRSDSALVCAGPGRPGGRQLPAVER